MTTTITRGVKVALMVLLTAAVAVGFTMLALPANAAQPAAISATPNTAGATATHTATTTVAADNDAAAFTDLDIDYSVGTTASDISNVGAGDISTFTVNGGNVNDQVTDVSGSNNGETLNITLNGSTTLATSDTIFIEFADAQNAASDDEVEISINGIDATPVTLTIDDSGSSASSSSSAGGGAKLEPNSSNDSNDTDDSDEAEDFEMVTINVMKHICAEGIQSVEDFNNVDVNNNGTTEFTDKVLSCPTVVMEGDDYYEGAISFSDKRDFNFRVTGQDNESQDIDDAELVNQQVCEAEAPEDEDDREENTVYLGADLNDDGEMNACADTSFYSYSDVAGGDDISVVELLSPTGQRGGALEFTPAALNGGFDEEETLGDDGDRFEGGVVEIDSTEDNDGTITLHLYNFQGQDDAPSNEELQAMLEVAREALLNVAQVLGVQDTAPSFPNTGDGSLSLSSQILN